MYYVILSLLSVIMLVTQSMAVGVPQIGSGDIKRYCQLKHIINPKISDVDLAVDVILNTGEMISISPDEKGLSDFYKFSAEEKDAYIASFLNATNTTVRYELIKSKILGSLTGKAPENCAVVMTRLGIEEDFNRRHGDIYSVASKDKSLVVTRNYLEVSYCLSKGGEIGGIDEYIPTRCEDLVIDDDCENGVVAMLRGNGYFQVAKRGSMAHVSVSNCSSGVLRVNVVISRMDMSDAPEDIELLCYIPQIGVYGLKLCVGEQEPGT